VPFAIGSETWGSILSPAAYCGVTGLRPTYGRVSRHGAMALCWTLDKLGPLALTADDCGLVLEAIAGPDAHDPSAADRTFTYEAGDPAGRRFRFGVLRDVTEGAEPAVRAAFTRSLDTLTKLGTVGGGHAAGAAVRRDRPHDPVRRGRQRVRGHDRERDHRRANGPGRPLHAVRARRDPGQGLHQGAAPARSRDARGRPSAGPRGRPRGPGRPATAPPLEGEFRSLHRPALDPMGAIGNMAGLPAVAVPNGFSESGLPTSLQFMGRAWADDTVLAAARAWQSITDWHHRHPAID
jgi:aspartyl-tRNA(Asn)/glutamyl-tRNA(Gln) amidotransferase subunit A